MLPHTRFARDVQHVAILFPAAKLAKLYRNIRQLGGDFCAHFVGFESFPAHDLAQTIYRALTREDLRFPLSRVRTAAYATRGHCETSVKNQHFPDVGKKNLLFVHAI